MVRGRAMSTDGDDTQSVSLRPAEKRQRVTNVGVGEEPQPSSPQAEAVPRGTAIGRYLVVHRLGQGGMGVVYAAYDAELDRKVALKVLRPRALGGSQGQARLLREAQAMAKVSHPNVIAIHDVGPFGNQVFMALDLVEGGTLSAWAKMQGRTWREIVKAMLDAGHGLAAAHAAGLVHRDFKPQNVLVRNDGQVFVTDFGLARMSDAADDIATAPLSASEREVERHSRLSSNLTGEGVVLGTPKYMAPEQHLAGAVDARADQFAFCTALYALLFKTHPFDPVMLARRADRLRSSAGGTTPLKPNSKSDLPQLLIQEPPSQPRIPARLRKAIMRGLALEPAQRFESMEQLLAEIQAALHPPSLQVALAAAGLAVVVVAAGGVWVGRDLVGKAKSQLCSGGAAEIAQVWSPTVSAGVQAAFAAVAPERGPEVAKVVVPTLDGYAGRWVQAHREACEATRIRGEQAEGILALRMVCLERRRKELNALVRLLEHPDAALVDKAPDAVAGLSAVGQCGDVEALAAVGRPEDPARREKLDKLDEALAKVDALRIAGRYPQGKEEAVAALKTGQDLAFKPLQAQALIELGLLEDLTGDQKSAARDLQESWKLAEAGHDDVSKVRAASRLGFVIGYRQMQTEPGIGWVHLAEATLERLGTDHYPELESDVLTILGTIYLRNGSWREAIDAFQRSLVPSARCSDADLRRARTLGNMGVVRGRLGEHEEAVKSEQGAIAAFEKLRGKDHPILIEPLENLSNDLSELGRFPEALAAADRALQLVEAKMGKDHASTADVLDYRAGIYISMGKPRDAISDGLRALEIHRKNKATQAEGFSLDSIGRGQLALGKLPEAIASLERALAVKPPDEGVMAGLKLTLARALVASRKDPVRARALAADARAGYQGLKDEKKVAEVDAFLAGATSKGRR